MKNIHFGAGPPIGRAKESIIEVNADDAKLETYRSSHHHDCITIFSNNTSNQQAGNNGAYADALCQLTASIACQMEEAAINQLHKNKIDRKREHDDKKKYRTRKIHKSIIRMLENAAAASALEVDLELAEGCQKFLNANTRGSAEQDLSHQFDKLNLTDICFSPGIVQCLFHGKFISANLSIPSNFMAFAFNEQPPLLCVKQDNYLICNLIHKINIKQSPKEIKSSLMQDLIVSKDYTLLGVQLQYFVGTVEIFFGSESIAAFEMRRLLIQMGCHKKQFRYMIALNEWFAACFLFCH
jgi:hypothetical protein